jgi:mRNA interferase MazF
MRRGEVWTLRDERFASKASPVVIVQADNAQFNSTVICLFTTHDSSSIATRVLIRPAETNGLRQPSYVMTEKIAAVEPEELGHQIGELTDDQMAQVTRGIARILGINP